jgi:DNA-directed RNA polymerase subunit B
MKAKQIEEGQYGRLCCIETPEGEMCGNARFHAQGSTLSLASSHKGLLAVLMRFVSTTEWIWAADSFRLKNHEKFPYLVNLDGRFVWRVKSGTDLVSIVRELRRASLISSHTGVNLDDTIVYIRTSPGRSLRLLLILRPWFEFLQHLHANAKQTYHQKSRFLFEHHIKRLLTMGFVEYIDSMEERSLSIAFHYQDLCKRTQKGERFSHMEFDPLWMTGLTAGTLPFFHCNQSPRSVLAAAMSKQTFSGSINPNRVNALSHVLELPTRAMCQSRVFDDYSMHGITMGNPVKLGLYITEYSMEDSWDMNHAACQLGMFRGILLRRYVAANKPWSSTRIERFEKPGKDCCIQQAANYDKIQADGVPLVGTFIQQDDILIGRTTKEVLNNSAAAVTGRNLNQNTVHQQSDKYDDSVAVRDEQGVVQSVRTIITENGMMIKQVVLRTQCTNEIGDKYMGRHGQKGTTGVNRNEADVPVSVSTGTPLFICMNPMQNFARQTSAFNTEGLTGKAGAMAGEFIDCSGFLSEPLKAQQVHVKNVLKAHGAHPLGYETHMSGITGKIIPQPIFTISMYMAPLAHLVGSKIHARDRGQRKRLTRQPDDGRAKNGGLRFGQMELDCLTALGCPNFLLDRLQKSDAFWLPVCRQCGMIAEMTMGTNYKFCRTCKDSTFVEIVSVSYSNKLFYQELMAMHVKPQLILKSKVGMTSLESLEDAMFRVQMKGQVKSEPTASQHEEPKDLTIRYLHDPRMDNEVIDNYFKLTWIPKPQSWEKAKYGIPNEITLCDKLQAMASREREREVEERKRQVEEQKTARKMGLKLEDKQEHDNKDQKDQKHTSSNEIKHTKQKMARKRPPVQSPSMMFAAADHPSKTKKFKR